MSGHGQHHPHGDDHHHHDHDGHHHHPVGIIDGPVVLDIGDGYGALIVTMPDDALGTELHARFGSERSTTHTGVWQRTIGERSCVMAVFAELRAGTWTLLAADGSPVRDVVVDDGGVATVELR